MTAGRVAGALCGLILAGFAMLALFPSAPERPADRLPQSAPALGDEAPLAITVLGTSLTARYDWPSVLGTELEGCLGREVDVATRAKSGANIAWGVDQAETIAETSPDIVLLEFAINDADLLDGLWLPRARDLTTRFVAAVSGEAPEAAVVLMTMNPARGPRGWVRPWLAAHYRSYREISEQTGAGLVDLYPRWLSLPRGERGLEADGLHPTDGVARDVIVPPLADYLADLAGEECAPR